MNEPLTLWTAAWMFWIFWFLAIESAALIRKKPGDTFSEHVWAWFKVKDYRPTKLVVAGRIGLGLFLVWLLGHLTMGWWTPS
jgi:hypothetical protein